MKILIKNGINYLQRYIILWNKGLFNIRSSTILVIFVKQRIENIINNISFDYSNVNSPFLFYIGIIRLLTIIIDIVVNLNF